VQVVHQFVNGVAPDPHEIAGLGPGPRVGTGTLPLVIVERVEHRGEHLCCPLQSSFDRGRVFVVVPQFDGSLVGAHGLERRVARPQRQGRSFALEHQDVAHVRRVLERGPDTWRRTPLQRVEARAQQPRVVLMGDLADRLGDVVTGEIGVHEAALGAAIHPVTVPRCWYNVVVANGEDPVSDLVEVVTAAMSSVGSRGPWFIERVPIGKSNVVHRVSDSRGHNFAVRVGRRFPSRFAVERAAIDAAANVGVPVAAVLYIGEVSHGDTMVPVMVSTWVDAPSLRRIVDLRDGAVPRSVVGSIATILARIHSVEVSGFGNLDASLSSPWQQFDGWFLSGLEPKLEASRAALADDPVLGSDPGWIDLLDRAVAILHDNRDVLAGATAGLAHGDVSLENLLVDNREGAVNAVLDWEAVKGGHPGLDFGWWDHIGGAEVISTSELIAAYEAEIGGRVPHVDEIRHLVRVRILIGDFGWKVQADPSPSLVHTARALAAELDALA
jgi:aminoglycoside phosphotransferase (APT) family kinase protein